MVNGKAKFLATFFAFLTAATLGIISAQIRITNVTTMISIRIPIFISTPKVLQISSVTIAAKEAAPMFTIVLPTKIVIKSFFGCARS